MFNLRHWSARRLPVAQQEEHPVYALQHEMNRVFDDFFRTPFFEGFGQFPAMPAGELAGDVPLHVDMSETDKELLVKIELPGMSEKDIDITITRDMLTISGEKKQEKEQTEKGWYRMERRYGSFSRSIPLPYEIESDKAEALYKNGVLSVKLPKSAVQQRHAKTITVKSA